MQSQKRILYNLIERSLSLSKAYSNRQTLKYYTQQHQIIELLNKIDIRALRLDHNASNIKQGVGVCNLYD